MNVEGGGKDRGWERDGVVEAMANWKTERGVLQICTCCSTTWFDQVGHSILISIFVGDVLILDLGFRVSFSKVVIEESIRWFVENVEFRCIDGKWKFFLIFLV